MSVLICAQELMDHWNYFIRKSRHRFVNKVAESVLMNMDIINAVEGAKTSSKFEKKNLLHVDTFKKRVELYAHALDLIQTEGLLMEFGTYKGVSINQLARLKPKLKFYGFDSFAGLPEGWTAGTRQGGLSTKGKLPRVRKNVELVQGFFDESLPVFLDSSQKKNVAFIHIDCDLYSSTKIVLDLLKTRLMVGTIIVFDEYYNYADWLQGEYKAWIEFCNENSVEFQYMGYIRMGSQIAVQITNI